MQGQDRSGSVTEEVSEEAATPVGQGRPLDVRPLPDMIGYALRRTQVAVFNGFRRAFADLEIRPVQLGILTVIGNNPGVRQSDLSTSLGIQRANLVPLLDALTGRGLIERTRLAADRRSHALRLTEAGKDLLRTAQRREAEFEAELSSLIGDTGRRRLIELLGKVELASGGAEEGDAE